MPKISVITTFYNSENYILRCINSIINQSFNNYEHILINDGSNDSSLELAKTIDDKRIKLFNPGKIGRSKALNLGLEKAKADYIAILDADDIAMPNRLESQFNEFINNESLWLICSNALIIDKDNNLKGELKYPKDHDNLIQNIFDLNPFPHSSVMFRRKEINNKLKYNERCEKSIDFNLYLEILFNEGKFKCLQTPLIKLMLDDESWGKKDNSFLQYKYGIIGLINYYQKINNKKGILETDINDWIKHKLIFENWFEMRNFSKKLKAKKYLKESINDFSKKKYINFLSKLLLAFKSDPYFIFYRGLGFKFPKDVKDFISLGD